MNESHLGAGLERHAKEGEKVTRFRPRYRALSPDEIILHDQIKGDADAIDAKFVAILDRIDADLQAAMTQPQGAAAHTGLLERKSDRARAVAIARTKLEEAIMWAVKGLTG